MWSLLLSNGRDDTVSVALQRIVRVYVTPPQTVVAAERSVRVYIPTPSAKLAAERIIRVYKEKP